PDALVGVRGRHADVGQDDVWLHRVDRRAQVVEIGARGDDVDLLELLEGAHDAFAGQVAVLAEHDAKRGHVHHPGLPSPLTAIAVVSAPLDPSDSRQHDRPFGQKHIPSPRVTPPGPAVVLPQRRCGVNRPIPDGGGGVRWRFCLDADRGTLADTETWGGRISAVRPTGAASGARSSTRRQTASRGGRAVELAAVGPAEQTSQAPPPPFDVIDSKVRVPAVPEGSLSRVGLVNRLRTTTTTPVVLVAA